ncbi:hypothetical protein OUZ56_026491 [Daphnia magna]|uniref:Uncharacterized protein n=1 Tax=Daphnia magna TaxID=35525 RepID=A0ABQ9ZMB0_9CRUS|nr:hypothetical protein OUZ56_026491 [Daphnia magna]
MLVYDRYGTILKKQLNNGGKGHFQHEHTPKALATYNPAREGSTVSSTAATPPSNPNQQEGPHESCQITEKTQSGINTRSLKLYNWDIKEKKEKGVGFWEGGALILQDDSNQLDFFNHVRLMPRCQIVKGDKKIESWTVIGENHLFIIKYPLGSAVVTIPSEIKDIVPRSNESLDINIARTINILGLKKRKDSVPRGRCHPPRKRAHLHHTEHAV